MPSTCLGLIHIRPYPVHHSISISWNDNRWSPNEFEARALSQCWRKRPMPTQWPCVDMILNVYAILPFSWQVPLRMEALSIRQNHRGGFGNCSSMACWVTNRLEEANHHLGVQTHTETKCQVATGRHIVATREIWYEESTPKTSSQSIVIELLPSRSWMRKRRHLIIFDLKSIQDGNCNTSIL